MDTPDISKIVGLIMQRPELIETIRGIMSEDKEATSTDEASAPEQEPAQAPENKTLAQPQDNGKRKRRNTLLHALKPYVSPSRARAIDTMMTIADMLDAVKGDE